VLAPGPRRALPAAGGLIMEKPQKSGEHPQPCASNVEYDLFSEMHALLKGNAALEKYIEDAQGASERDVESCFKAIHAQNTQNVTKLRTLIEKHLKAA
jgi:hypothetical protein